MGGDGSASIGLFRGMAPGVQLVSYGLESPGGIMEGALYTDPLDIEADYTEAISLHGADLSNASLTTNTSVNGYPCTWEGNYGATGALLDAIARGSLGSSFPLFWSAGNERSSGRCGTGYWTTPPPGCAKNRISVGALNSDDDSMTAA